MIIQTLTMKVVSMGLMMVLGALLVKIKILRGEDSKVLSLLSLYLIMPCVLITAFQVDLTDEVKDGLILAAVAAVLIHIGLILLNIPMKKVLKMNAVERMSVTFSNAGNLIIPLVTAILGKEYVIYSCAFMAVQMLLLWSYCKGVLCGEKGFDLKKVFTNINMIAIFIGLFLLFTGIRLPSLINDTMDAFAVMVGPMAMLVTGMLIGEMKAGDILKNKRIWLVTAMRLIIIPVITLLVLKFSPLSSMASNGHDVLLITLLATITPSASTITQQAQVYHQDAAYAGAINVLTTILCIVTMPLMIWLYQL